MKHLFAAIFVFLVANGAIARTSQEAFDEGQRLLSARNFEDAGAAYFEACFELDDGCFAFFVVASKQSAAWAHPFKVILALQMACVRKNDEACELASQLDEAHGRPFSESQLDYAKRVLDNVRAIYETNSEIAETNSKIEQLDSELDEIADIVGAKKNQLAALKEEKADVEEQLDDTEVEFEAARRDVEIASRRVEAITELDEQIDHFARNAEFYEKKKYAKQRIIAELACPKNALSERVAWLNELKALWGPGEEPNFDFESLFARSCSLVGRAFSHNDSTLDAEPEIAFDYYMAACSLDSQVSEIGCLSALRMVAAEDAVLSDTARKLAAARRVRDRDRFSAEFRPLVAEWMANVALEQFSASNHQEAFDTVEFAVATDEENSNARFVRGQMLYLWKQDMNAALDDFSTAIRLNPNKGGSYMFRSEILLKKGEVKKALADANRAVEFLPNSIRVRQTRAALALQAGQYATAESDFTILIKAVAGEDGARPERMSKEDVANLRAYYWNRGLVREKLGHGWEAASDFYESDYWKKLHVNE